MYLEQESEMEHRWWSIIRVRISAKDSICSTSSVNWDTDTGIIKSCRYVSHTKGSGALCIKGTDGDPR